MIRRSVRVLVPPLVALGLTATAAQQPAAFDKAFDAYWKAGHALNDVEIFPRRKPSGRVDVKRDGNAISAFARGVREFTLLISPDVFDLSKPIVVAVNDRPVFERVVTKDPATLFKWAARDNDRTMLYAAEIRIQVP